MKTLKHLVLALLLSASSIATAQDYKKEIEKEFIEYLNFISTKQFEKSMEYLPADLFKIVPKEQMVELMERTFNDSSITFEFINPKVGDIKDAKKIEAKFYSFLSYSNQMNIKINKSSQETEEEQEVKMSIMKASFEKSFGAKNVSYNVLTGFFEIQVDKKGYAISENGQTDWKFLVVEKEQKPILEKLLPKELYKKL